MKATYLLPFLAVLLGYFLAIIVKPAKKKTIKLLTKAKMHLQYRKRLIRGLVGYPTENM